MRPSRKHACQFHVFVANSARVVVLNDEIMVPIIVTYSVLANADEGVDMERIARAAIRGKDPIGATIEDSGFDKLQVENVENDGPDTYSLHEQISEYIEGHDYPAPKYLSHEVTDSR